jgi:hypothetical protein
MMLPPPTPEALQLPNEELALRYWAGWIELLLRRRNLSLSDLTPEIAEQLRIATLSMDGDSDAVAGEEKFLRRIASGDLDGAGRLIRQYYKRKANELAAHDEARTGRRKQRERARAPREDALQRVIMRMVKANPNITARGLLADLKAAADRDDDQIHDIDENSVSIADIPGCEARSYRISGLADRLSRAKKKVRNASGR